MVDSAATLTEESVNQMKLEEAASILGVSLEDITIDGLKQTYKKLALTLDPENVRTQMHRLNVVCFSLLTFVEQ